MTLLTPDDVRLLTGSPASGVTEQTIERAVGLFEAATRRSLRSREVTETLTARQLSSGAVVVFPSHRPVTEVSSPERAELRTAAIVEVPGYAAGWGVELTYVGGYTAGTLPLDIAQVVAHVAASLAAAVGRGGPEVSPAADQVAVEGVSAALRDPGYAGLERLAPGCTPVLRRWSL